jgi:HPt (histidine-containing phosphotransfer) domain-containing protein
LIDVSKLSERVKDDLSRCMTLCDAFLATARNLRSDLQAASAGENVEDTATVAHSLKGFLGELGCEEGSELAASINFSCRQDDITMVGREIEELLCILELLERILAESLERVHPASSAAAPL